MKKLILLILLIGSPLAWTSEFNIAAYRGQVVYVDFWASWCGPCRASFPWMNSMHAKYAQRGLKVVAVNEDANRNEARAFLEEYPAKFEIYYDTNGKLAERFKVSGMPTSYLFNRRGELVLTHAGFRKSDEAKLERLLSKELESQ